MAQRGLKKKQEFVFSEYKKQNNLDNNTIEKPPRWIPMSDAFQKVTGLPGMKMGHINLLRGHSDTGKTTALLEAAVSAQKMGLLPIFLISEMKYDWEYAIKMGFKATKTQLPDGNFQYSGDFIYHDIHELVTIEGFAAKFNHYLDEQEKGKLPMDLCFLWDSIGMVPCNLSKTSDKSNNEWNAGAMSREFGNGVDQRIVQSSKTGDFTNTLVAVNHIWVQKPDNPSPKAQPKMKNKAGETMWKDATIIYTFGNVTNAGTSKVNAINKGSKVEYAKMTKISVEKNHAFGLSKVGRIAMTQHGFIEDNKTKLDQYKDKYRDTWNQYLDGLDIADFETEIEEPELENSRYKVLEGGEVIEEEVTDE